MVIVTRVAGGLGVPSPIPTPDGLTTPNSKSATTCRLSQAEVTGRCSISPLRSGVPQEVFRNLVSRSGVENRWLAGDAESVLSADGGVT
jgi:hypothetical protein